MDRLDFESLNEMKDAMVEILQENKIDVFLDSGFEDEDKKDFVSDDSIGYVNISTDTWGSNIGRPEVLRITLKDRGATFHEKRNINLLTEVAFVRMLKDYGYIPVASSAPHSYLFFQNSKSQTMYTMRNFVIKTSHPVTHMYRNGII